VQRALIEQIEQIKLRLALMDRKFVQTGEQTECDSRTYLAWANTYGRLLERLGIQAPSPKLRQAPAELANHLATSRLRKTPSASVAAVQPPCAHQPRPLIERPQLQHSRRAGR
jgi:hypothetical protein